MRVYRGDTTYPTLTSWWWVPTPGSPAHQPTSFKTSDIHPRWAKEMFGFFSVPASSYLVEVAEDFHMHKILTSAEWSGPFLFGRRTGWESQQMKKKTLSDISSAALSSHFQTFYLRCCILSLSWEVKVLVSSHNLIMLPDDFCTLSHVSWNLPHFKLFLFPRVYSSSSPSPLQPPTCWYHFGEGMASTCPLLVNACFAVASYLWPWLTTTVRSLGFPKHRRSPLGLQCNMGPGTAQSIMSSPWLYESFTSLCLHIAVFEWPAL